MEILPGFILPLWSIITIISAAAAALILIIIKVFLDSRFLRRCEKAYSDPEAMKAFIEKYPDRKLLRNTRLIEKAAARNGKELLTAIGIDKLWEEQFLGFRKTSYLKRFIRFFPKKGLFFCILAGKSKPVYHKIIKRMVAQDTDPNLLRKLSIAGNGRDFDGEYALAFFTDRFQELIELAGDPEWYIRFFAIKMLIFSDEERAERAVWEAFNDSHAKIRRTAAEEFKSSETERLAKVLKELLLNDPSYVVRKAARIRLDNDFPEQYRIDIDKLNRPQLIHLLGQLRDGSDEDADTAMKFLLSEHLEIRLQAALYLQKQKLLNRLFTEAVLNDKQDFKRRLKLLTSACEVDCTLFLNELSGSSNPATVRLAAELLKTSGKTEYIDKLASKIFAPSFKEEEKEHYTDIYKISVECISLRGSDYALGLLNREMIKQAGDEAFSGIILPFLPERGEDIFIPSLISFLKRGNFPVPELLRKTIERFRPSSYIEEIIQTLYASPKAVEHSVRKEAFKILGELSMPCCLQVILENMNLLEPEEQKEFAVLLTSYDRPVFEERVSGLLKTGDSTIKASILNALPPTGITKFIKYIEEASKDPDPDVRTASIRALAGFGEVKMLSQMTAMLRDPVERVRVDTAEVIASHGTPSALNELKDIVKDPNEVYPVKAAVVSGLGGSEREEALGILISVLTEDDLREEAIRALSGKNSKKDIKLIIDYFKDASPQLREYIAEAFKAMGESVEPAMTELLSEDIASMKELLAEIMLKTGFIETTVRKLSHRKPDIRKKAAALLALIQTREAFKGIVLAARDPDSEVRVEVLKALEKLNTPEGEPILKELKDDPDKRVRKYTLWAMERIEAKNLVE